MFIWFTTILLGCNQTSEKTQPKEGEVEDVAPLTTYTFNVMLAESSTFAGESIPFEWVVVDQEGESFDFDDTAYELSLSDSLEPEIYYTDDTIRPTIMGSHGLAFGLTFDDQELTAQVTLETVNAAIDSLDLIVSNPSFIAGETTSFSITAADRFGNSIDTSSASIGTDLQLETETTLTETVSGLYSLSASLDGMVDSELVEVLPTAANSITMTADTTDVEVYQTLHCTIEVLDLYGNSAAEDWTLWAEGVGQTTISHQNVTFWEEGSYMLYAQVDDTTLIAELGPINIDSSGPVIEIFSPPRGDWSTSSTDTLDGNVEDEYNSLSSLSVNGISTTPDGNGDFSAALDYIWGLNLIETTASDSDANSSSDLRSVLYGNFIPSNTGIDDGLVVRIGDNPDGFGAIETYGEGLISTVDLISLLPSNPIYSNSSQTCTFLGCFTWYSVDLNVGSPSFSNTNLEIDTRNDGTIQTSFLVFNPQVQWWADGVLAGIGTSASGQITAYSITVDVNLTPNINNGAITMTTNSASSSIGGFNFNMSGFLGDVLDFFGVTGLIEDQIKEALKDAIEDAVIDEIPNLLEDSLQDLEFIESFDIMGNSLTLIAEPSSVSVDDDGLSIGMTSLFYAENWVINTVGEGSLYGAFSVPSWDTTTGAGISLSVDSLNQLFYEVWGAGGLSLELTADELGTSADDLAFLFPNASDLRFTTTPLLPPVIVEQNGDMEMQIGDLGLTIHNGALSNGDVRLDVYMSLFADVEMTTDSITLSANIGTPELHIDVVYPDGASASASDTEALLTEFAPLLLPVLTDAIGEISIPTIQGFNIQNLNLVVQDGNIVMSGTLGN